MFVYIIIISILSLAFVCKRDKKMFCILFVLMVIIMGCCTDNADFKNYEQVYNYINSTVTIFDRGVTSIESGTVLIFFLCKNFLNFEYEKTLLIITILGLFIIGRAILKYTEYPALVLALYFIAPFFPCDIIQIRNFIAEGIVITAILRLFSKGKNTKLDYVCYILLIVLACLFHIASVFFVLVLLIDIIKERKIFTIFIVGMICCIALLPYIIAYLPFIPTYKIEAYMSETANRTNLRDTLLLVVMVMEIAMSRYLLNHGGWHTDEYNFVERIYKVHILLIISMAMIMFFNSAFYRLPRNLLVLDYIVVSKYISKYKRDYNRGVLVFYVITGLLWSTVNVFSEWNVILQNNSVLRYLW